MPERTPEPSNVAGAADGTGRPRIGICLSGGGFRASAFGFGVVRYLVEAGLAPDIRAISAVSGGSVTAAMLAAAWPSVLAAGPGSAVAALQADAFDRFQSTVASRNLRNRGLVRFAGRAVLPGGRHGSARGSTLARNLLDAKHVADLPSDLQVILTATDLATGRAFRMSQSFIGSWDHGYADTPPKLGLATALAASTAVPLLFPPVHLRTAGWGLETERLLSLMDGGVYDNLGLEWFQGWNSGRPPSAQDCDFIIVVDCSGPVRRDDRRAGWARSVFRSQAAQYAQSRSSRIRWFVDHLLAGRMHGLHIPMDRDPAKFLPPAEVPPVPEAGRPALPVGSGKLLGRIRTDLDRFSREETQLLAYNGYWATHTRLAHIRPDLAIAAPAWREFADLTDCERERVRDVLDAGAAKRAFR